MKLFCLCLLLCCIALPISAHAQDTITTASGLKYTIVKKGKGRQAQQGEFIIAHYTGTLTDGTVFDSSRERNQPFVFQLGQKQVIKGWDEAFSLLHVGDRAILILPPDLAYGERGAGDDIGPGATLIFDVELVDVKTTTLGSLITEAFQTGGREEAKKKFKELKKKKFAGIYMDEDILNRLAYKLLQRGSNEDALVAFQMCVEAFPKSFNAYDSLGEAYKTIGNKGLAIKNYECSLKLNPENENAVIMLKELRGK